MDSKEAEYINYIVENNYKGLNSIYTRFLPMIMNLITSNGGSKEDAMDVFQDAILIIYEKIAGGNFVLSSKFYTLLYGICRNLWGTRLQKKSFHEVTLTEEIKYKKEEDLMQAILKREEFVIFTSNFQKLGSDCRQLLQLFFEKVKMKDIQKQMGFSSLNYCKKRKFQCKEKLIVFIKKDPRYIEIMGDDYN